jgi:hypothetical protein
MKMMMRRGALIVGLLGAIGSEALAQSGRTYLGPRVSYNFDFEEVAIGAQLGLPLTSALDFYPSLDIFLVDNGSLLGFNADLKFRPGAVSMTPLYIGGGLNLMRASVGDRSDTEPGLNLFAGIEGRSGGLSPFAELRAILGDRSTVQLAGGINFSMGSRSVR